MYFYFINFINKVIKAIDNWSNDIEEKVKALLVKYVLTYKFDIKEFCIKEHNSAFFNLVKNRLESIDSYKQLKIDYMLKQTYRLEEARRIIKKWSK